MDNEFDYICVSRAKLKNYKIVEGSKPVEVEDRKHQKISLQKVESENHNDFFLKIESQRKRQKEESMNNRFQEGFEKGLKSIHASLSSIYFCWKEIVRILNTQKAVTTTAQNNYEEIILIRRCSVPNEKVQAIYDKLKYKSQAFTKRKFVVHKSELQKMEYLIYQEVMT